MRQDSGGGKLAQRRSRSRNHAFVGRIGKAFFRNPSITECAENISTKADNIPGKIATRTIRARPPKIS
ncbi:MAG TPA: hypothetical protein V6D48_17865, partial [Oculatellaceae cyanobacterium]